LAETTTPSPIAIALSVVVGPLQLLPIKIFLLPVVRLFVTEPVSLPIQIFESPSVIRSPAI
jgi:hypothetical protein